MRSSAVTNLTALGTSTAAFTILTGETLTVLWNGSGRMVLALEYQAEGLTGSPWVQLDDLLPDVTDWSGAFTLTSLPRGNYRASVTEYHAGNREVQFVAS